MTAQCAECLALLPAAWTGNRACPHCGFPVCKAVLCRALYRCWQVCGPGCAGGPRHAAECRLLAGAGCRVAGPKDCAAQATVSNSRAETMR